LDQFPFPAIMTSIGESDLKVLEDSLLNTSGDVGLHNRFRALFTLKSLKSEDAVRVISAGSYKILSFNKYWADPCDRIPGSISATQA
jgi:hypothetical protein